MSIEVMVNGWISSAHERGASDIHIEPADSGEDRVRVRMRVDGDLRGIETVGDGRKVMARVKIMAGIDVNERNIPLDGRIKFASAAAGRGSLDLRVSSNPCMGGEKIVLRLIDNSKLGKGLEELGYTKKMLGLYKPIVESPYGLLLHVGPTGSGKTTSLYAIVTSLNRTEVNIQTVEDPCEYNIPGVTQTQVNHDLGLNFPKVLRALLRQDPNVILVGEIRDAETAEIALEASMTGHLVLSTLHANEAVGAVVRLLDMGITPYSIAYALRCVIAQRFVKRLCEGCRKPIDPPPPIVKMTGQTRQIYIGEGCKPCQRTGYSGRVPLFECMPMAEGLKRAIYDRATPDLLQSAALKGGMISMWEDGLTKAWSGLTSIEEVLRVTKGLRQGEAAPARPAASRAAPPPRPAGPAASGSTPAAGVRPASARPAGAPKPPRPPVR